MSSDRDQHDERHISTDRETIKEWADQHDAVPVRAGTGEIRLVPESQVETDHERLDWSTFHDEIENEEYVVFYHGETGEQPFEVASHSEALTRTEMDREELQERLVKGETVTSQITETTVVESVVVEEATIESELVGREIIDEQVADVELRDRECRGCTLVADEAADQREWFDRDRYLDSLSHTRSGEMRTEGTTTETETTGETRTETERGETTAMQQTGVERDFPYTAELDVEEAWTVTRDVTERFTVESRITETDVTEAETIEDHDIDVEGLQRSIAEQGLLGVDHEPQQVMKEYEVESEFTKGDRIQTHFERTRVIEDDVVDRMHAYADITSADIDQMDITYEEDVATEMTGDAGLEPTATEEGVTAGIETEAGRTTLTKADEGKRVVDADGEKLGTVEDIDDDGRMMYVETHSGLTERIKSALGWGDKEEHENAIYAGQVAEVADDEVRLKGHEELGEHRESHDTR